MSQIVRIEHANVRRDGKMILKDASLSLNEGEHIAIVGPNGAGKSTLLDVISRNIYPLALDEYKSLLFGEEKWMRTELEKLIGTVSERNATFLNTSYNVREIVCSGLYSSLGFDFHHQIKKEDWLLADEELKRVGLYEKRDRIMNTLSSGEKRRIMLARVNINKPKLLLLDEASSALDFPSRAALRRLISTYTEKSTIIMVTHELSEILPEIKRVLLMKEGKIVMDGKKEEVLTEENLSALFFDHVHVSRSGDIYTAYC